MKLSILAFAAAVFLGPFVVADNYTYSNPEPYSEGQELEFVKFYHPHPKEHYKNGGNIYFDYIVYAHPERKGESLSLKISLYDKWSNKYHNIAKQAPVKVPDGEKSYEYHYKFEIRKDYNWKGEFELTISEEYQKEYHKGAKTIYYPIYIDDENYEHRDDSKDYKYDNNRHNQDDHDDKKDYKYDDDKKDYKYDDDKKDYKYDNSRHNQDHHDNDDNKDYKYDDDKKDYKYDNSRHNQDHHDQDDNKDYKYDNSRHNQDHHDHDDNKDYKYDNSRHNQDDHDDSKDYKYDSNDNHSNY